MKKIINNRKYDTDTATLVVEHVSGSGEQRVWEILYRKRSGEYFLEGSGGPFTRYAEQIEMNQWTGGHQLIPMSYEAARQWAADMLNVDEFERAFGEIAEDDSEVAIGVRISSSAKRLLDAEVSAGGRTQSAIIDRLITENLPTKEQS
jgi:hypothetical protein